MSINCAGLTNGTAYNYLIDKKRKMDKSPEYQEAYKQGAHFVRMGVVVMVIGVAILIISPRSEKGVSWVINGFAVSALGMANFFYRTWKAIKLKEYSRRVANLNGFMTFILIGDGLRGLIGLEHLIGSSQRKDLLIEGFKSYLPKKAIKEMNFDQLKIVYEACPEEFNAKRKHLNPFLESQFH